MDAFRVKAEFITIFDEKLPVEKISLIVNNKDSVNFITEPYEIQMHKNEIKLIKAVKIYVESYVQNGKAYSVTGMNYEDINEDTLSAAHKELFGQEYVGEYAEVEAGWRCVCGKINTYDEESCSICGRKRSDLKRNNTMDYAGILKTLEEKNSAREMKEWLAENYQNVNNEVVFKMLKELEKIADFEKMYGNAKTTALNKIRKVLDEIDA